MTATSALHLVWNEEGTQEMLNLFEEQLPAGAQKEEDTNQN